jgi:hypothetical protein
MKRGSNQFPTCFYQPMHCQCTAMQRTVRNALCRGSDGSFDSDAHSIVIERDIGRDHVLMYNYCRFGLDTMQVGCLFGKRASTMPFRSDPQRSPMKTMPYAHALLIAARHPHWSKPQAWSTNTRVDRHRCSNTYNEGGDGSSRSVLLHCDGRGL